MPHPTSDPPPIAGWKCTKPPSAMGENNSTSMLQKPCFPAVSPPASDASAVYSSQEAFLEHLDRDPDNHFLAPIHMYEYEDWAENSDGEDDDDADDFQWDAGITDFALFNSDRRLAEESNKPLPSKWNDLLDKQTSALQRAQNRRCGVPSQSRAGAWTAGMDDLPGLTPDDSPRLRDDLDVDPCHSQDEPRPTVPNYLTISVSPPEEAQNIQAEGSEIEASKLRPASHAKRKQQRPGLRHSRTMSGQEHAWRRPSMYTVGEEPDNERREELIDSCSETGEDDEQGSRGRGLERR